MDWSQLAVSLLPVAAGLGGAWIMGRFTLKAQEIAQRNENIRHARKVAYDAAVREYGTLFSFARDENFYSRSKNDPFRFDLPTIDDFILYHVAVSDFIADGLAASGSAEDFYPLFTFLRERSGKIAAFRANLERENKTRKKDHEELRQK